MQIGEAIVHVERGAKRRAASGGEIVRRALHRNNFPRRENVVIIIHERALIGGQMQSGLRAITAGKAKIWMETDAHRKFFFPYVFSSDDYVERLVLEHHTDSHIGLRRPMPVEIAPLEKSRDARFCSAVLVLHVLKMRGHD